MKGISVLIRKVTLHNDDGYCGVRWYHPSDELPPRFTDSSNQTLGVRADDIVNGVVVSEPFVVDYKAYVVVQLQTEGRFESYETFWVGCLG